MHKDTTTSFTNPAFRDELSELVREGAQRIIRQAVEAELGAFLEEHSTEQDTRGRKHFLALGAGSGSRRRVGSRCCSACGIGA